MFALVYCLLLGVVCLLLSLVGPSKARDSYFAPTVFVCAISLAAYLLMVNLAEWVSIALLTIALYLQVCFVEHIAVVRKGGHSRWMKLNTVTLERLGITKQDKFYLLSSIGIYALAFLVIADNGLYAVAASVMGLIVAFANFHFAASIIKAGVVVTNTLIGWFALVGLVSGFLAQFALSRMAMSLSPSALSLVVSFIPLLVLFEVMPRWLPVLNGRIKTIIYGAIILGSVLEINCKLALQLFARIGWIIALLYMAVSLFI